MVESDDHALYQANGATVSRGRLVLPESLDEQSGRPRTIAVSSLQEVEIKPARSARWIACMVFGILFLVIGLPALLAVFSGQWLAALFALVFVAIGIALICIRGETSKWYIRLKFVGEGDRFGRL